MYQDVFVVTTQSEKDYHQVGPFAVPSSFSGGKSEYRLLIRKRYATEPAEREAMRAQAWWYLMCDDEMTIEGPFADEAKAILKSIAEDVRIKLGIPVLPPRVKAAPEAVPEVGNGYRGRDAERRLSRS